MSLERILAMCLQNNYVVANELCIIMSLASSLRLKIWTMPLYGVSWNDLWTSKVPIKEPTFTSTWKQIRKHFSEDQYTLTYMIIIIPYYSCIQQQISAFCLSAFLQYEYHHQYCSYIHALKCMCNVVHDVCQNSTSVY